MNERDQKVNFLGKMIALVEFMTNEKLDVKPAKIVAGLEPEKTNEFLQAMFKAATSGVDSLPYVKQILGVEDGDDDGEAQEQARQAEEQRRAEEEEKQRQMAQKKQSVDKKKNEAEEKKKKEAQLKKQ